ncbi:MAG TPA: LytTR family DNA-binding domain-containing protein, partial [Kofleriaceae bacterium]
CVHAARGRFDVDLSLAAIEVSFGAALVRVHRNWLVNIEHVLELEGTASDAALLVGDDLRVPVARERAAAVRELLLANSAGVRRR